MVAIGVVKMHYEEKFRRSRFEDACVSAVYLQRRGGGAPPLLVSKRTQKNKKRGGYLTPARYSEEQRGMVIAVTYIGNAVLRRPTHQTSSYFHQLAHRRV